VGAGSYSGRAIELAALIKSRAQIHSAVTCLPALADECRALDNSDRHGDTADLDGRELRSSVRSQYPAARIETFIRDGCKSNTASPACACPTKKIFDVAAKTPGRTG